MVWCVCHEVYTYVAAALPHLQAVHQTQNCLIFEAHGFTPSECALYMAVYNMILTYMHHLMKVYLVAHASIVVLRSDANERNIISYFNYYLARQATTNLVTQSIWKLRSEGIQIDRINTECIFRQIYLFP